MGDIETPMAMKPQLDEFEMEVSRWPHVSVHSHRFGGREFRLRKAEVGHLHTNGVVDIPFPRSIRNALLEDGLAEKHRWVPDSGWTTFRMGHQRDLKHGLWLMRLSYVRYALKTQEDPLGFFEKESSDLQLSPHLKLLLASFVPSRPSSVSAERLSA